MKKYIIAFMQLCLIFSCQERKSNIDNCKEIIETFHYPSDIELLADKKYVCDSTVLDKYKFNFQSNDEKNYKGFKVIFSDKNYTLAEYDLKTRLLIDRNQDLCLIFKASEVGNFYFNNPKNENLYGLFDIYIVDENLMPLFSFNKSGVWKYRLNDYKKTTEFVKISLINKEISHNIDTINYNGILKISSKLKNGNYKEVGNWEEQDYYRNPPIWTEL